MGELSWAVFENTKRSITISMWNGEPFGFKLYDAKLNRNIMDGEISNIKLVCFADYTMGILERAEAFLKEIDDKMEMKKRGMKDFGKLT